MNDLDLCLEVVSISRHATVALHLTLHISETVRDRGLVPKDHQKEMALWASYRMVTWPMTSSDLERSNSLLQYT